MLSKRIGTTKEKGKTGRAGMVRNEAFYITKLSESKLAPMIPRCKNGIEVHRLASIISAGCPRVVYYYPHLTSNVQFMALLSDVITFAQTEDYFVIKCADALKEDHEMRRAKDAAWWERQRIPYLFSDLEYVDSKIKNKK